MKFPETSIYRATTNETAQGSAQCALPSMASQCCGALQGVRLPGFCAQLLGQLPDRPSVFCFVFVLKPFLSCANGLPDKESLSPFPDLMIQTLTKMIIFILSCCEVKFICKNCPDSVITIRLKIIKSLVREQY